MNHQVGIAENFLSPALAVALQEQLLFLQSQHQLLAAGTGNDTLINHNTAFRGDLIYWLDRTHNQVHENTFLDIIDRLVLYLNETCYTGISGYEFHYTLYEAGRFYKTHVDSFRNNDSRKFSLICYLNPHWANGDGGELCIHHTAGLQNITPTNGKCVFFQSHALAHEVLLTHVPRMSITGWLK